MANGRIYGLAAEKGWGRLMCRVAPLTSEVSRAKDMARLKTRRVSWFDICIAVKNDLRINGFVIINTRMSLSSVETACKGRAQFSNETMICDTQVS